MKILAIIPARGGSKGIRNKNIRPFAGKPLIAHTIDCAKKFGRFDRIIVSTDLAKIAAIAKKFGAEIPFLRPAQLARDKSSIIDVVVDILAKLKNQEAYQPDFIVLLQPTNPMRTPQDITQALALLKARKAEAVVSVCATEQLLYTKDNHDFLQLVSHRDFLRSTNRQQLQATYRLDGSMIYIIKTSAFLKNRSFIKGKLVGYQIPRWRAVDLDEPQDFVVGELIYRNFKILAKKIEKFK